MNKARKSTTTKPAQKNPAMKKSSTKPKRKAEQHSQLAQIVTRLEIIADKLAQTAEHLAELGTPPSHPGEPQGESPQQDPPQHQHEGEALPDFTTPPIAAGEGADPDNGAGEQ
jgi:hypothetical protein